jgi:hypothetical protein
LQLRFVEVIETITTRSNLFIDCVRGKCDDPDSGDGPFILISPGGAPACR